MDYNGCYKKQVSLSNIINSISDLVELLFYGIYAESYYTLIKMSKPNSIGVGLWNKQNIKLFEGYKSDVKSIGKLSDVLSILWIVLEIMENISLDCDRQYEIDRIISNIFVNLILYLFIEGILKELSKYIATVVIPIPFVGTFVGAAAGFIASLIINKILDLEIKGKTIIDYLRDVVYYTWKNIFARE